jgi:hypothetical protein
MVDQQLPGAEMTVMTAIDQQCAALYTGGDTTLIAAELRHIIEHAITNHPRSLQTRIGPSELGNPCDRCLISKLAGIEEARDVAWLPFVGTGVHDQLERIILAHEAATAHLGGRYLTETQVTVGTVGGVPITGHCDLFDLYTGTELDYKCVGATTLRDVKANGPSETYKAQGHLYGKGFEDAGYTVRAVSIWYLPRNEPTLANAYLWQEPYNRAVAQAALDRADMYATAIQILGPDAVLADAAPHIGGHSCHRYGEPHPTRKEINTTSDLINLD